MKVAVSILVLVIGCSLILEVGAVRLVWLM